MDQLFVKILADISGQNLVQVVVWIIIAGVIFWLLNWLVDYCAPAEPFRKIAKVVIALVAVVLLINALLGLTGHGGFIRW